MISELSHSSPVQSIHQWIRRVREAFRYFDGMFLGKVWEGEFILWPPSLTYYPCDPDLPNHTDVFSCRMDEPSLFRVCLKSQMPYHGYLVSSPVYDRLYKALKSQMPDHVTVMPLMDPQGVTALVYFEKREVKDRLQIPSLATLQLQWDMLNYLFLKLYQPRPAHVVPLHPPPSPAG
jgi:hypothetical protein